MSSSTLEDLIEIHNRAARILHGSPRIMKQFILTCRNGFVDQLPNPVNKPHMASTAQCLRVIFRCESLAELSNEMTCEKKQILDFFDSNCWESSGIPEHNLYVAPQILVVLSEIGVKRKDNSKVDLAIKETLSSLKLLLEKNEQQLNGVECGHGFILYWAIRALKEFETELEDEEKEIVTKVLNYTKSCLFNQLALDFAGDESEFDVVQLAYYLSSSVLYGGYSNREIIDKAINVVFDKQQDDGTWKLSQPFLQRPEGGVMNCSSIEVPTAIMRISHFSDLANNYLAKLKNTMDWVERNFKNIEGYEGWRSDSHATTRPPESWVSALVYEFLDTLCNITQKCIARMVLKDLNVEYKKPEVYWPEIVDFQGMKQALEKNVIRPIVQNPELKFYNKCGVLLFGPPGTGKDSITYALAHELGDWPVVNLSSVDFLANGPDNIIKTAMEIFKKLMLVERALIFFNEVDELFASRDAEQDKLGKFITNSMLPLIEKLKKNGKVIFVVATNHVERFELAVRRRGRFDLVLPIGLPDAKEKKTLIKRYLPDLNEEDLEEIAAYMDNRMTIREVIELCGYVKENAAERGIKKIAIDKIREMNQKLEIDPETMKRFGESLKLARYE